jgi:hypothetical protein
LSSQGSGCSPTCRFRLKPGSRFLTVPRTPVSFATRDSLSPLTTFTPSPTNIARTLSESPGVRVSIRSRPQANQVQGVSASRHPVLLRLDSAVARLIRGYTNLRRIVVDVDVCGIETELVPLEELSPELMHLRSPRKLSSGSYIKLDVYQAESLIIVFPQMLWLCCLFEYHWCQPNNLIYHPLAPTTQTKPYETRRWRMPSAQDSPGSPG